MTMAVLNGEDSPSGKDVAIEVEHIQSLSRSIKESGLLQPVVAYETTGGAIELLAGERRWWACQLAGLDTIDVMLYPEKPTNGAVRKLSENLHRRNLDLGGVLRGLMQILDERKALGDPIQTGDALKEATSLPRTTAFRWWQVLNGPEDIREAIYAGRIPSLHVACGLLDLTDENRKLQIKTQQFTDTSPDNSRQSKPQKPAVKAQRKGRALRLGTTKNSDVVRQIVNTMAPHLATDVSNWNDSAAVEKVWRQMLEELARDQDQPK
ncbi:ParB/RepB/Spo0J family partition protein [Salinisphaera sp. P385]|uniref:ParB/RepB/Spo0J family partition protein n=1 Tax=Spectribacter acetivorans TaxID=3075603 RepID=A0ABU3BBB9_9GAMM|nr:ParB/RepB/Spo0J family partition protein [Salinisphaera sp. P385]MDT0618553.1 ParB/RepB/Spo0J family partition protein [Salinisphaera sp. P385]